MTGFTVHTIDSAPAESADALSALNGALGFIPNLAATMAESPTLLNCFATGRSTLTGSTLSGVEREIVAIAVSFENDCDYCMAAHSTFALMQQADADDVKAARSGRDPLAPKLAALYRFARAVVAKRGHVSEQESEELLDAGCSRAELFDAVAQIANTTLANYAHSVSNAPLDAAFEPQEWARVAA